MINETLSRVAGLVEARLESFFEEVASNPTSTIFGTLPASPLLDQVRALTMRGGKRLRAVFLVQSAKLFDPDAEQQPSVIDAAAAMELLHTYFLIHDDIMDDDEMRRGGPAVHVALAEQFGSVAFGQGLGILAGDLAEGLKQILLVNMDVENERRENINRIFAEMHLDVIHGQTLDMFGNVPPMEIAARKTASYTTVGPITAGAALAGASQTQIATLADIAYPLGIAFQFRDDLLDVYGQAKTIGKPVGTDLKEGKRTLLIEEGLKLANDQQRKAIESVFGKKDADEEAVKAACAVLTDCGAKDACQKQMAELVDTFISGLEKGPYLEESKQFLIDMARYIVDRTS
jgi:geranylgeranyl diphosphate synthase type I